MKVKVVLSYQDVHDIIQEYANKLAYPDYDRHVASFTLPKNVKINWDEAPVGCSFEVERQAP